MPFLLVVIMTSRLLLKRVLRIQRQFSSLLSSTDRINDIKKELKDKREKILKGGDQKRIDSQHKKGKLTARERIAVILDDDSFSEYDAFMEHNCTNFGMEKNKTPCDSVVSGHGTINGRRVFLYRYVIKFRFLSQFQSGFYNLWREFRPSSLSEDLQNNGSSYDVGRPYHWT